MNVNIKNLCAHEGRLYQYTEQDLVSGYVPVPHPMAKMTPWLSWLGGKITMEQHREALSFLQWTYDKWKAESQLRLYYHIKDQVWVFVPFPQEISRNALTTDEFSEHPLKVELEQKYSRANGWVRRGSYHHHCGLAAFQSGTDHKDEVSVAGLHITIGKMDEKKYDLHSRHFHRVAGDPDSKPPTSSEGTFYSVNLEDWFEPPEALAALPKAFQQDVLELYMTGKAEADSFPAEWKDAVIEKKWTTAPHGNYKGTGAAWQNGGSGRTWVTGVGYVDDDELHKYTGGGPGKSDGKPSTAPVKAAVGDEDWPVTSSTNPEIEELQEGINELKDALDAAQEEADQKALDQYEAYCAQAGFSY